MAAAGGFPRQNLIQTYPKEAWRQPLKISVIHNILLRLTGCIFYIILFIIVLLKDLQLISVVVVG